MTPSMLRIIQMTFNYTALVIIGYTALSTVLIEFLSWLFVYRTSNYKRMVSEILSCGKRFALLDSAKNKAEKDNPKKKKKLEAELMGVTREFSFRVRGLTSVFTFGVLFGLYKYLSAQYSGVAVGKLPFHAPAFLHRMTHMTLEGEDYLECSALFIYLLSGLAVRTNITKFLGLGPSRTVSYTASPQFLTKLSE
ncbi:hypothetical protein CEUSTIGMA_g7151.t1 [Chlamydomonas eustigma]|uniref:Calcium load-activated calcium channel n=1 Tax=Chlamydomonas eustigma TaxID=1157962 RepID=A0A250XAC7_9CHLO|nr:hypothetical protein CEUSTIGMA_g7151.t1 [Chlamydomonas eustigma]|eukprot:GAX79710.1 hypothetical protein CEUSTIGMA_g7151.t1 [Chlamydomonas eustigma]